MASSAQYLENERIKKKLVSESVQQTESRRVKFEEDIEKLKQKLEQMKDSTVNSTEKIKGIEKMIEVEEKLYNIYVADTEKINSQLYRGDKLLKEQLAVGKSLELESNNTMLICSQLKKRIHTEKTDLEKFKEVVYNMVKNIDY